MQEFITETTQNCKTQGPCAAAAAHQAQLPIQARMPSYVSASTFQGSTGPHLRNASSHHARAAVRVHHASTFACPSACGAWRRPISTTCGKSWRLRRPGSTPFWRRWGWSSGSLLSPQSLPRLRAPVAHEESFLRRTPSVALTLLCLQNQVTSSKLVKLGAPLGLHYS